MIFVFGVNAATASVSSAMVATSDGSFAARNRMQLIRFTGYARMVYAHGTTANRTEQNGGACSRQCVYARQENGLAQL